MAKNTGRGSRAASGTPSPSADEWADTTTRAIVVWAEADGVALYEGEKATATRRRLLTPAEADELALLLRSAARDVRGMA